MPRFLAQVYSNYPGPGRSLRVQRIPRVEPIETTLDRLSPDLYEYTVIEAATAREAREQAERQPALRSALLKGGTATRSDLDRGGLGR
jgi:hypothetical protein